MKPSLHVKLISFGNVVRFPNEVPFVGTDKGPQSFAKRQKETEMNQESDFVGDKPKKPTNK